MLVGLGFLLMASPEAIFPASQISSLATVMALSSDQNEPLCSATRNSSFTGDQDCSKSNNDHIGPLVVMGLADQS